MFSPPPPPVVAALPLASVLAAPLNATEPLDSPDSLRIRVRTIKGVFLVYDAMIPPDNPREQAGYLAYWSDVASQRVYFHDALVQSAADVGRAMLALERDLLIDLGQLTEFSPTLAWALDEALFTVPIRGTRGGEATKPARPRSRNGESGITATAWHPLTVSGAMAAMGFDVAGSVAVEENPPDLVEDCDPPPAGSTKPKQRRNIPDRSSGITRAIALPAPTATTPREIITAAVELVCVPDEGGGGDGDPPPPPPPPPCGTAADCPSGNCAGGICCDSGEVGCSGSCFPGSSCCGGGAPCAAGQSCSSGGVCCASGDRCCTGDPCCGSPDNCCAPASSCCGSSDPCCNPDNPCCGNTDPCDALCGDPCLCAPNPCCGVTDPCDAVCGDLCLCNEDPCDAVCGDPCLCLTCDDGDLCTTDSCVDGACVHEPRCSLTQVCCEGDCCGGTAAAAAQSCCDAPQSSIICCPANACCAGVCCNNVCCPGNCFTTPAGMELCCSPCELLCGSGCCEGACADGVCCDDNNPCTIDTSVCGDSDCLTKVCEYSPACDDGNPCTTNTCQPDPAGCGAVICETTCNPCAVCPGGVCVEQGTSCTCQSSVCSISFAAGATACPGGSAQLTFTADCWPDCGTMSFGPDPANPPQGVTVVYPAAVPCTGGPVERMLTVRNRARTRVTNQWGWIV